MWRATDPTNLEKKPLDAIEPGALLGREGEQEVALWSGGGEPDSGFP